MRHALIVAALLCAAGSAIADSEARNGSDVVRFTAKPCADEAVVAAITADGDDPKDYRAASANIGGQAFAACWKPLYQREHIFLRYGDGDAGLVPFSVLQPVREV